ncbi:MBL fold metallo-hydrolase [Frigoribacterium salinisoli]
MSEDAAGASPPRPTSAHQAEALARSVLPAPERVGERTWSLALPVGERPLDATLAYLLEGDGGELALVDPGWGEGDAVGRLRAAVAATGHDLADVGLVVATHLHADHLGAAEAVRRATGARVAVHALDAEADRWLPGRRATAEADLARWGVPTGELPALRDSWAVGSAVTSVVPDLLLGDGDLLPLPGRAVRCTWTPGHTAGHLCLVDPEGALVLTGDHVLPHVNPGIGLGGPGPGDPVSDVLASLGRVADLDDGSIEVAPGHGYRFRGLRERSEALSAHRLARDDAAARALDALGGRRGATAPTVWELASHLPWTGGFDALHGATLGSALAQTAWHVAHLGRDDELHDAAA